jgi:hypothetical protein
MHERKSIGIFVGLQRGFMHETANGEVRHQQTIELLLHQFWSLAPQHNLGAPQMGFQLIQSSLDLPSLVIEGRQFLSRRQLDPEWW